MGWKIDEWKNESNVRDANEKIITPWWRRELDGKMIVGTQWTDVHYNHVFEDSSCTIKKLPFRLQMEAEPTFTMFNG